MRTWDSEQIKFCVSEVGNVGDIIVDVPFPDINPLFTSNQVKRMAEDLAEPLLADKENISGVILQGESSFVYYLNEIFRSEKIPTFASATIVEDEKVIGVSYRKYSDMSKEKIREPKCPIGAGGVVINLTNHPSMFWTEQMRRDVLNTTKGSFVSDIGIPFINGKTSEEEIVEIAKSVYEQIALDLFEDSKLVLSGIICQGESSFCNVFIQLCKKTGLPVYCSTNHRVVESVDGKKVSKFKYEALRKF